MQFYSQYNQDRFLYENFFKNQSDGYFVDIGAHDGVTFSNSLFFEKLGWEGSCFEPIPSVFKLLESNRNCFKHQIAISDKNGFDNFLVLEGYTEMLSGIYDNYDPNHLNRVDRELQMKGGKKTIIEVPTSTFNDINLPEVIDYVSLDVEGSELKILQTIDFEKYYIKYMTVEVNNSQNEIYNLLTSKGFSRIGSLGCDDVYKNNKN